MSFSIEQKNQIINEPIKNSCCRKALLCGILASKAKAFDGEICFNLEKYEFCEFSSKLIYEFYGKQTKIETAKNGGRCRTVSFSSKSAAKYLSSISQGNELYTSKCPGCSAAFFKGVFLSSGNFSNPEKQYLLELFPHSCVEAMNNELEGLGLAPRLTNRKGKKSIYFRRASEIEDFCGFVGMTAAMFKIANTQIEREFLNNTNRIVNCETNNIEKTVNASAKQIEVIRALINRNLLSNLPDELEYTARLRIQNESLSLAQLSKLFTPPISKSGLSHRLSKIMEIAELLLG